MFSTARIVVADVRAPLMGFLAMGAFWGAWGALIPQIKFGIAASDGELGLALLCVAVGAVPAMLIGGRLVDKRGPGLLPASIGLFAVAAPVPALARDAMELAGGLFVLGAASGLMDVAMNARVSAVEASTGRRYMHLAHGLFAVLYVIAAVVTGQARSAHAPSGAVLACIGLIVLALALLARGQPPPSRQSGPAKTVARAVDGRVLLFGLIALTAFLSENGLQSWSALHLERTLGAEADIGSLAPAAIGLAVAIGRLGGQILTARLGDAMLVIGSALLGVVGATGFAMAQSIPAALACLFLSAAGISVIAPSILSLAGRTADPARRGAVVGSVSVIAYTGFFVGPAMLGLLADMFGLQTALLAIAALLALVPPLWWLCQIIPARRPA